MGVDHVLDRLWLDPLCGLDRHVARSSVEDPTLMAVRPFLDRADAGVRLGAMLAGSWAGRPDVIVLGVPRGGVPVAFEVAKALDAPLDVFTVRKLGVPGHEELAFGAVGPRGRQGLQPRCRRPPAARGSSTPSPPSSGGCSTSGSCRTAATGRRPTCAGRTAILVDDGLATGASMRAAVTALRQLNPAAIVVAVPVGTTEACQRIGAEVDEVVCVITPEPFVAVGAWYDDFSATSDAAVRQLLDRAAGRA